MHVSAIAGSSVMTARERPVEWLSSDRDSPVNRRDAVVPDPAAEPGEEEVSHERMSAHDVPAHGAPARQQPDALAVLDQAADVVRSNARRDRTKLRIHSIQD
jgi:hypothetical protein